MKEMTLKLNEGFRWLQIVDNFDKGHEIKGIGTYYGNDALNNTYENEFEAYEAFKKYLRHLMDEGRSCEFETYTLVKVIRPEVIYGDKK